MIAKLILCSILAGLSVRTFVKAEGLNEREELKLQAAFDTIFDDNPKIVLNSTGTLEQLKVVERLATIELNSAAGDADDDIIKTLQLIKKMIEFGQPSNRRCLNKELLREYLEIIDAHLMPSLWSWQVEEKAGSNGYRYVQHGKAVQHQLCRNHFWAKMKEHIDSFRLEERERYEQFADKLANYRFELDQDRLIKGSVDYLESKLELAKTKWALKRSSEKKNFENAYKSEVVYLCLDYEKKMRSSINEYNYILKDEMMINSKSYHWIQLGYYCNLIAMQPLKLTEAAYQEALRRRDYVGVQVPHPTKQPFNESS